MANFIFIYDTPVRVPDGYYEFFTEEDTKDWPYINIPDSSNFYNNAIGRAKYTKPKTAVPRFTSTEVYNRDGEDIVYVENISFNSQSEWYALDSRGFLELWGGPAGATEGRQEWLQKGKASNRFRALIAFLVPEPYTFVAKDQVLVARGRDYVGAPVYPTIINNDGWIYKNRDNTKYIAYCASPNFQSVASLNSTYGVFLRSDDITRYSLNPRLYVSYGRDAMTVEELYLDERVLAVATPSYTLTANKTTMVEGEAVTITLTTSDIVDGTLVPYVIGGVSAIEIGKTILTDNFTISSNQSSVTITTTEDTVTTTAKTLIVSIPGQATTVAVSITDATTTLPVIPPPGAVVTSASPTTGLPTTSGIPSSGTQINSSAGDSVTIDYSNLLQSIATSLQQIAINTSTIANMSVLIEDHQKNIVSQDLVLANNSTLNEGHIKKLRELGENKGIHTVGAYDWFNLITTYKLLITEGNILNSDNTASPAKISEAEAKIVELLAKINALPTNF